MSAVLQKSNKGSYQRVLYGKRAPEAQIKISTADGITTLVPGDIGPGEEAKKNTPRLHGKSAKNCHNNGKGRSTYIQGQQSHKAGSKGTTTSSGRGPPKQEKAQTFSGLGRVL